MTILIIYVAIFVAAFFAVRKGVSKFRQMNDYTSLKTVTFGDESAVRPDRWASVISVVTIFLLWGAFTGSKWVPIHAPGPFIGDTEFVYTLEAPDGSRDDATVYARVFKVGEEVSDREIEPGDGFAKNDSITVGAWRSELLLMDKNDEAKRKDGAKVVAIDGQPVAPGDTAKVSNGTVAITSKGSLNFAPSKGMQMEPIWLPPPESVVSRVAEISEQGYQNFTLFEHLYWSLFRVVVGFALGALVGIPLGYAMGLSDWFRGWFDPIVEFMRPVPPLALIPLVIIWAGIGESGKIILLFLAALWIMTISARAGVSGVAISKVHAAYSLGASKWQLMRYVIMPNSLPEIFTGARVAMGVCWGTVVAAELVAAEKGAGMMIMVASRFQLTDIVIMGIILIGIIGYGIDILMRKAESWLVPWKGRA
ncbi:taurine transport system permease protein [Roseovarius lutimaris]|uniref:Taurine transport system permease protein n=1 Tax=Roseovarius lutimaris TaxID=1005928 RepID=A0A1I4ZQL3_9RHOB|nr:ABC transporter permease subunit [Roseovarius lutimaris]SFN52269.1 taurine transport system permease protein [Roseovarius lutimaris]